jgi:signal peptidase I
MENFYSESLPDPEPKQSSRLEIRRFLLDILETIIISVLLFLGINSVSARIRVESISMQPTLYEGNFVLVNRLVYRFWEPERGDVIVFHPPAQNPSAEPYIKRVIGEPGDVVRIENGNIYINDQLLYEPYIKAAPNYQDTQTIPEGYLYVLGDNRNNSSDSHRWGLVPISNVIGRAEFIYWPIENWKRLHPSTAAAAPDVNP